jgi:hypothetical protein
MYAIVVKRCFTARGQNVFVNIAENNVRLFVKKEIKFIFDDDEDYEYESIIRAHEFRSALGDIYNILRKYRKYEDLSSMSGETLFEKIDSEILDAMPKMGDL